MTYSFLLSNIIVLSLGILWQLFGWYHATKDEYKNTSAKVRLQILLLWLLTTTTILHAFPIHSIELLILSLSFSVMVSLIILNIGYAEHKLHGPSIIKSLMEKLLIELNTKIVSMAKHLAPKTQVPNDQNTNDNSTEA